MPAKCPPNDPLSVAPPADLADDRARVAMHEACHAVVALVLAVPVDLLSIRPGEGYRGATLFAPGEILPWQDLVSNAAAPSQPPAAREAMERDIIVSLAGPASAYMLPPLSGHVPPDHDEERIAGALVALQRLDPALACRLLAAESEPDSPEGHDSTRAQRVAWHLNGFDRTLANAHIYYLAAVANELVSRHRHAINAVAAALLEKTVLMGSDVERIAASNRCICHEWSLAGQWQVDAAQ